MKSKLLTTAFLMFLSTFLFSGLKKPMIVNASECDSDNGFCYQFQDLIHCNYNDNPSYWDQKISAAGGPKSWFESLTGLPYEVDAPSEYVKSGITKLQVNMNILKNQCMLVYGSASDVNDSYQMQAANDKDDTYWYGYDASRGYPALYLGFARNESTGELILMPNPKYPEWFAREHVFGNSNFDFYAQPWKAPWGNISGMPTDAMIPDDNLSNPTRISDLATAIDKYNFNLAAPAGDLYKTNSNEKSASGYGPWILYNKGTFLSNYAHVELYPSNWSFGFFKMYFKSTTSNDYNFTTVFMPPKKEFFSNASASIVENNQLVCSNASLTWSGTPTEGQKADLSLKVTNTSNNALSNFNGVALSYRFDNAGESIDYYFNKSVNLTKNGTVTLTLSDGTKYLDGKSFGVKDLIYPAPSSDGTVTFIANINSNHLKPSTENWSDNRCSWTIPVKQKLNVDVKMSVKDKLAGKTYPEYAAGVPLNIPIRITNDMGKSISLPCVTSSSSLAVCKSGSTNTKFKVTIKDASGNVVPVASKWSNFQVSNLPVGTKTFLLDEQLESGIYSIHVDIPEYQSGTNLESSYSDNTYDATIRVLPVPPSNVDCNLVQKADPSKGITNDLAKMCVGYYPNFPSTKVEGGMGTYFYVKYFFFPLPLPEYTITNGGTVNQTVSLTEDRTQLGNTKTWLYYPTTKNGTNPDGSLVNPEGLPGPYMVGPHEFYHYRYRGRMVAERVDFNFQIFDPNNATIAKGSIIYEVPTDMNNNSLSCLRTDAIDYKENTIAPGRVNEDCREISFFLPNDNIDEWQKAPDNADKINFLNPGKHSFRLSVYEYQKYYYQVDQGDEWQGKAGVPWRGNPSTPYGTMQDGVGPVKTRSIFGETYISRHDFKNHVEQKTDSYGNDDGLICYHDHNKDYHYWKYIWSQVQRYNTNFKADWVNPTIPPEQPAIENTDCNSYASSAPGGSVVNEKHITGYNSGRKIDIGAGSKLFLTTFLRSSDALTPSNVGAYVWKSEDGGRTFTKVDKIVNEGGNAVLEGNSLQCNNTTCTLIYHTNSAVYIKQYSTSTGAVATSPIKLQSYDDFENQTSLVKDNAGVLHAAWVSKTSSDSQKTVYYSKSTDGGKTWSTPTKEFTSSTEYVNAISLMVKNNKPFVVFSTRQSGTYKLYFHWMDDSTSKQITSGTTYISGVNAVTDTNGKIHIAFNYGSSSAGTVNIYYYSTTDGSTFSSLKKVTNDTNEINTNPTFSVRSDGTVYLTFNSTTGAGGKYDIFSVTISPTGTWGSLKNLTNTSSADETQATSIYDPSFSMYFNDVPIVFEDWGNNQVRFQGDY